MSGISNPTEDMDDASKALVQTLHDDEADTHAAAEHLLEVAAEQGDRAQQDDAVEMIATLTKWNKSVAEDWLSETKDQTTADMLEVPQVKKQIPPGDDDVLWEFHVVAAGKPAVFRLPSSDLSTQQAFATKVLEVTNVPVDFDNWKEQLHEWLTDADIMEEDQPPITPEHSIVRKLLSNIGSLEATRKYDKFRQNERLAFLNEKDEEVWVRSEMVESTLSSTSTEVSRQRLRSILGDLLSNGSKETKIEDKYVYIWRFDAEELFDTDAVDRETLEDSADHIDNDG